ncbi:KAP family P-loop domain protein [Teredinibacter turnerae T7901]|uniref:KAP family P-loop domain protein n=1 Tax=Teredinibacter turnerae (strain ATCC 39867 / T7901) TaxID=377629 RepID=C5BPI1_TERTT|nr:P-loop NTPase fold protein [Teredinibacter turnerae]ACR13329.1 KAP family P-loop domain protein [Teredinibacter turnerae T7901]
MADTPSATPLEPVHYWIFQATPGRYDLHSELHEGAEVNWTVTRFISQYKTGDIVYVWQAGDGAGIYGYGRITGETFVDDAGNSRVPVRYEQVFTQPLRREQLLANTGFRGLTILRNATGTNFRVTLDEVCLLNDLVSPLCNKPVPSPLQSGPGNGELQTVVSARYLLDYRYDEASKKVVSMALGAVRRSENTLLASDLVQSTFLLLAIQGNDFSTTNKIVAFSEVFPVGEFITEWPNTKYFLESKDNAFRAEILLEKFLSVSCSYFLSSARRIAVATSRSEHIGFRHLFGAILIGEVEAIQPFLDDVQNKFPLLYTGVHEPFLAVISSQYPEDNQDAWRELIQANLQTDESPHDDFLPLLTRLDSDSADDAPEDLLDVDRDAIALAKVLCARDAAPPLAIGLFGDWGSGKTFFMRRLRMHVNTLTQTVVQEPAKEAAFCGKVAQIWFNAWHYQEANLWASMVNHVFAGLKQELRRLNPDTAEKEFNALMARLDNDRVMEKELEHTAEQVRDLREESLRLDSDIAALQTATEQFADVARPEPVMAADTALVQLQKYKKDIADIFGKPELESQLEQLVKSGQGVQDWLAQFRRQSLRNRVHQWLRFFMANRLQLVLLLGLVLAGILGSWWMMSLNNMPMMGLISVLTLLSSAAFSRFCTRFGKILHLVSRLKDGYEIAQSDAQRQLGKKRERAQKELQELQLQKQQTLAALASARLRHDELNAHYGRAGEEAFASFVFSRAASADYQNELGILNTVRRDFSRLDELLREQETNDLPKLNRIVLYIDDLDRCEPRLVVDVLQAIHLMLAFPLFMVVVGVDARWLGRALKQRYPFLHHESDADIGHTEAHQASTHDYLEKIFQIPFWLKPLDENATAGFLRGLLRDQVLKAPPPPTVDTGEVQESVGDEPSEESEDTEPGYVEQLTRQAAGASNSLRAQLLSSDALLLSEYELQFIAELGGLVGRSPRAVKRFVNLYRILKASHPDTRLASFSDEQGLCRVPLLLLAVLCGFPKGAADFFNLVSEGGDMPLGVGMPMNDGHLEPRLAEVVSALLVNHPDLTCEQARLWLGPVARFGYREWLPQRSPDSL